MMEGSRFELNWHLISAETTVFREGVLGTLSRSHNNGSNLEIANNNERHVNLNVLPWNEPQRK